MKDEHPTATPARRAPHRRNEDLERLLRELSALLEPVEREAVAGYRMPQSPPIFVVGAPRSGTTLFMQWIAATGRFAYPTNLLSRFYAAPLVGARIQQLLTDPTYDWNGELFDLKPGTTFESRLGKTRGALAPNEFWYFWRRFVPNEEPRHLSREEEKTIDGVGFAAELAAIESAFGKPLVLKAFILQYNIPALSAFFDKALFLHIRREPAYNVQSLLESRDEYYGSREAWYSAKPREYESLKRLDPVRQVAGQVHYTDRAIAEALAQLDSKRGLSIHYEDFCREPEEAYTRLVGKLAEQGCELERSYAGPKRFEHTNVRRLPTQEWEAIVAACRELEAEGTGRGARLRDD